MDEAHGQQNQVRLQFELGSRNLLKLSSTRWQLRWVTTVFTAKLLVVTEKSRPRLRPGSMKSASSAANGAMSALCLLSLGGCGMISSWVTDSAPWRIEVPMQSDPVSPPPITTTCLPAARISSTSPRLLPATRRFCCGRKFMAKWTPSRSRPGTGKSRGCSEPPHKKNRVVVVFQFACADINTDMNPAMENHTFGDHLLHAPVNMVLFHLEIGNSEPQKSSGRSVLLIEMNLVANPRKLLCRGKSRRTGTDDRDLLAGSGFGISGLIQPFPRRGPQSRIRWS